MCKACHIGLLPHICHLTETINLGGGGSLVFCVACVWNTVNNTVWKCEYFGDEYG